MLGGANRLAFHGVNRVLPGSSTLLPEGGRINLTLRRVTRPPSNDQLSVSDAGAVDSGAEAEAGFGPPLATTTSAGRSTRSPIA